VILRGPTAAVRAFSDALTAERGVSHGQLNVVSVEVAATAHSHGYRPVGRLQAHTHLKPKH
jgi:CopG family nickel-responsive transcriptional regulator